MVDTTRSVVPHHTVALIDARAARVRAVWDRRCTFAAHYLDAYLLAMRNTVSAAIDRRVEGAIVAWLHGQWPVLRLVPKRWILLAVRPTSVRLRRSLSRITFALAIPAGIVLTLLTVGR